MAQMFINGKWQDAESGETAAVKNPATGELVDRVPKGSEVDARKAVDAAAAAFPLWSQTPPHQREKILRKGAEIVDAKKDRIVETLTKEQGKPLSEATIEIDRFIQGLEFYAGLASKIRGAQMPLPQKNMYGMVLKQPIGVCAAIVPWNFPVLLMGTKVSPALAAGNTMVVKPASTTPLSSIEIIGALNEAGLPPGALNIVTGPGGVVGEELIRNPKVRRVAFTGETETGRHVMQIAGSDMKRVTLELGGSDPMIVCADADLDRAATMASVGRFFNCGQICIAVKRLYLFENIADEFIVKLKDRVERLAQRMGNGSDPETRLGPLHTENQREEVDSMIVDAVNRGAKVVTGGKIPQGEKFAHGYFYSPTLLVDVDPASRVVKEECFGPALPIFRVKDLDDAIQQANSSIYGLGSSIWTRDLAVAQKAAERLEAGNVWINAAHIDYDELPFGGVKQSGVGREHGYEALEYYLETKGVVVGI